MAKRSENNKQGKMQKEANQLYQRPQMTGQARDEEEEDSLNKEKSNTTKTDHTIVSQATS